jgi:hypothetical protein
VFGVNYFAGGDATGQIFLMLVNSYQISINLPLTNVRHPANILYLQNAMRPFATFDIADAAEGTGYHLNELPIWNEADDSFE